MDNLTLKDCLKNHVDSYGLDSVVKALADVCHDKAKEMPAGFDGERAWKQAAMRVDEVRLRIDVG